MQQDHGGADGAIREITEGRTRLLVPSGALESEAPPRDTAFFNPRSAANRDASTAAYAAHLDGFDGPPTMLEPLAGVGARGLRAANETGAIRHIHINDINPKAVSLAGEAAALNRLDAEISFSNLEACRFLSNYATRGSRGAIVDIDPFGSPAPFFDCAVRSLMHGGLLSCTATDLQVLNGLFDEACQNRYGGMPTRGTTYGSETAIRIVLGCLRTVAARLGVSISPVFVSSDMHYYRMYARIKVGHAGAAREEVGYATHCDACGGRWLGPHAEQECRTCGSVTRRAGPLWRGPLFDEEFVDRMAQKAPHVGHARDGALRARLERAREESAVQGTGLFYTLDEMASRTGVSPPSMAHVLQSLREAGYSASRTSLAPTGFRTDAPPDAARDVFRQAAVR